MLRLFEQHQIRKVQEFEGMWDFQMEGFDGNYRLPVPGCWEQHPSFSRHRGRGIYTKELFLDHSGTICLTFKGVSHTADVYFNGEKIVHHYNAFTPFSVIIQHVSKGKHKLKVSVDNTFGEHSALHVPNDYYTYGGITRPVAMEYLPDAYIKSIQFLPYKKENQWHARMEIAVANLSEKSANLSLSCHIADTTIHSNSACLDGNSEMIFTFDHPFPSVEEWSTSNPSLYLLHAILSIDGEAIDDQIERVGFRTISLKDGSLLLNGKPIFLKGFNRHEDYAALGCSLPLQLMVQDMDLLQDLGANAVRTCHYPNDERFLDLCDERGILVWEENHARGLSLERMQNPNFDKQCEDCIQEMIENHYNHPSILIWGILNECASDTKEGRAKYKRQYEQIKRLDASRPTTSATCRHFTDICLDLPDIVSVNLYPRWYENMSVEECCRKELEWISSTPGNGKPIIVSEMGAGAVYGYRDRTKAKWSEELQAEIIRECLATYMNQKQITGVFIWQFADCRVTEEEWFQSRPRSHNNKGVVDEYRRPKLSYDVVKEMFSNR